MHSTAIVLFSILYRIVGAAAVVLPLGSISHVTSEALVTFSYSTPNSHPRNWIAVFNETSKGPEDGIKNSDPLSWVYAPLDTGTAKVSVSDLEPGQYQAYLLAKDGLTWLANPTTFTIGDTKGSLAFKGRDGKLTFDFATSRPGSGNWIGIWYANGGGPIQQQKITPPVKSQYISSRNQGSVNIDSTGLPPGLYTAYFLANDGYRWLANPIDFFKKEASRLPLTFLVNTFTTRNAKQQVPFAADIRGLLDHSADESVTFRKVSSSANGNWVDVSSMGTLAGVPGANATGDARIIVEATTPSGSLAILTVTIPIRRAPDFLVNELTAVSFNMWMGGTKVNDSHRKAVSFIAGSGADIVGLQESQTNNAYRLAQALGWYAWQGVDSGIISRYPIAEVYSEFGTDAAGAVRIALDEKKTRHVIFWNAHLGYNPYGPYQFCFSKMSQAQVMRGEASSGRTPQINAIMENMQSMLQDSGNLPVIFTGDFNAPSHLDWTEENKAAHCGIGYVPWPTSKAPVDAGLIDSYRELHPDPITDPGYTWSPIYLINDEYWNKPEPKDRIDFIYYKGDKIQPISSETMVVGRADAEPKYINNEWPTDHAAVRTRFKFRDSSTMTVHAYASVPSPASRLGNCIGEFWAVTGVLISMMLQWIDSPISVFNL